MAAAHRILVVDDEDAIREMLGVALGAAGFDVLQSADAQSAHGLIIDEQPDLVLLDWMMPGVTGLELLRRLRRDEITRDLPVILLTAKAEEPSKVLGLDAGADDYVAKPFSRRELISRVKAVLRRSRSAPGDETMRAGSLSLNTMSHEVLIAGKQVQIGPTEFRLLRFFMTNPERVYSRDQILNNVWGGNAYLDERTVDVHIRRLRKAIASDGHEGRIQTVRGAGYRFALSTASTSC